MEFFRVLSTLHLGESACGSRGGWAYAWAYRVTNHPDKNPYLACMQADGGRKSLISRGAFRSISSWEGGGREEFMSKY